MGRAFVWHRVGCLRDAMAAGQGEAVPSGRGRDPAASLRSAQDDGNGVALDDCHNCAVAVLFFPGGSNASLTMFSKFSKLW
jgi:hypothetical protein